MPPERAPDDDIFSAAHPYQVRHPCNEKMPTLISSARPATCRISLPLDDKELRLQYEGPRSPTDDGNISVQRLLVLTAEDVGGASSIRVRLHLGWNRFTTWPARSAKWARMAATDVKTRSDIWRENYQLPYFILLLGVLQVALQAAPLRPLAGQLMWAGRSAGMAQPWRFISYVLPHTGAAHLALNVVVQTLVGVPAEAAQGTARVVGVYVGGALSGALATAIVCPTLQVAGSSAAIYALLTSHLADVFLNREWISHPAARAGAVMILAVADAAYTLHHALSYGNLRPRIGLAAHAAGAVVGLPLGLALYRRGPMKRSALLPGLPMTSPPSASRERVVGVTRATSVLALAASTVAAVAFLLAVPYPEAHGFDGCCS